MSTTAALSEDTSFVARWNEGAREVLARRDAWYETAAKDADFIARGGKVYPYDIIHANAEPLDRLMIDSGFTDEVGPGSKLVDVGCANGDLSYSLALAGHHVTAVDWAFKHDQAPSFVAAVVRQTGMNLSISDLSVDQYFGVDDIRAGALHGADDIPDVFDLAICFGLLYHLKNPFAFLESLSRISKRVILGTHLITHEPGIGSRIDRFSMAYLVDALELNSDPTNYWMLTEKAFRRLAERSGFTIEAACTRSGTDLAIATPDRTDLGVRGFLALRSTNV